ncbi:MAG: PKD domain-containing protein [Planctomycetota bacterium]|nr:PKD domain-containing protein [Planctomycetota bacterium]
MAWTKSGIALCVTLAVATLSHVEVLAADFPPKFPPKKARNAGGAQACPSWCKLPHRLVLPAPAAGSRLTPVAEVEPNNTTATATVLPLGDGAGQDNDLVVSGTITPNDDGDFYKVTLKEHDILGFAINSQFDSYAAVTNVSAKILMDNDDISGWAYIYPSGSPLPLPINLKLDLNAAVSYIVPADGDYYIAVASYQRQSGGSYQMQVARRRPYMETQSTFAKQIIYLDFNGGAINPLNLFGEGLTSADISPMRSFLPAWGLADTDEDAIITRTMAIVKSKYDALRKANLNGDRPTDGIPGHYDVEFQNSRDNVNLFGQPFVSRVLIGGTIDETGLDTIGLASCVDPGNFSTQDTAIVLLDLLSAPIPDGNSVNTLLLAPGVTKVEAVAQCIAVVAAHEAGHFLGCFHTEPNDNIDDIMDSGGAGVEVMAGTGPNMVFGDGFPPVGDDVDKQFVADIFDLAEGIAYNPAFENVPMQIAVGLSTGTQNAAGPNVIPLRPDLTPIDGSVVTSPVVAGMPFTVRIRVGNAGIGPSTDCLMALFLNQTSQVSSSAGAAAVGTVPALQPGELKTVQLAAVYPDPGEYMLAVLVDADNGIDEINEQNNMLFLPVVVFARGIDLVITNVTTTEPDPGLTATFDVTIQNRGMTQCGAFAVGFYANQSGPPTVGQTPTAMSDVAGLAPTATTAVRFTLPTQETRRGGYAWFFADYNNVIAEDIETNNTARATWGVPNDAFIVVSELTASTTTAAIGESVQFSIVVTDPNNDPIGYYWEFGDGTSQYGAGTVTHAFAAEGFYTVTVTVSDGPFHIQTSSVKIEVVHDIVDLARVLGGPVSLSVKKGRFRLMLPRPEGFAHNERLKSALVEGNPGAKVRYRNSRLYGIATAVGQYLFLVEYQSRLTHKIVRVRYRLTVVP